jgi:hypothetical protein
MLILENMHGHYDDALERHYDYIRFSEPESDTLFFHGMGSRTDESFKAIKPHGKRIYFNYEQPCAWTGDKDYARVSADVDRFFDKIYTACPYTARWINGIENEDRFEIASHPFNEEEIVLEEEEKIYDVLYWGGVHHDYHKKIVETMYNYKYNFLTLGPAHWRLPDKRCLQLVTDTNIPRKEMWSLIRKTKINIIVNLLFLKPAEINNIKSLDRWEENECFSHLESGTIPQQKTRAIESAVNRCLMLVRRDPWNVIEHWFEPDVDFIYYDDEEDLPNKINEILLNWDSYSQIIENAFQKVVNNYTTEKFINRIKGS